MAVVDAPALGAGLTMAQSAATNVSPITATDLDAVGTFLQRHLNERVSAASWASALTVPWDVDSPNRGFQLTDREGRLLGVLLAFYSQRSIGGVIERFCNLGAWCVLDEHRMHSFRLLRAALAQRGYTFTDLSPSGAVIPLNERLGFTRLDTTVQLVPCSPVPSWRTRVVTDPARIEQLLPPAERRIFRDHRGTAAAHHVVLRRGDRNCYVIYRRDRRRNIPAFVSVIYVSDATIFREGIVAFGNHVLRRHEGIVLLLEERVVGRVRISRRHAGRPKMFKSATVCAGDIDNLYSELTCVAW